MDILLNGLDELVVLLRRVRVVHAQVADAAEFLGRAEIDAQRLAVTDVQVAVRLRREAGVDSLAGETAARREIGFDKGFNKVFGIFHSVFQLQIILQKYYTRFDFCLQYPKRNI